MTAAAAATAATPTRADINRHAAAFAALPTRAEISRNNAQKSTGPRSPLGKQRVKYNALKHGLRAKTIILPDEEDTFHARLGAWTNCVNPRDEIERLLLARAVEASCHLDRASRARKARADAARHADAGRLAAQAEEVVVLGQRLYFDPIGPLCLYPHTAPTGDDPRRISYSGNPEDPDDPARLVVRLEAMALGCAWLLDRWGELRDILEDGLLWLPHDRLKAIRMLGRQPLEAVDDRGVMAIYLCCWAMNPAERQGFTDLISELAPQERTVYQDRLNARDPMAAMPASPEAARAELLTLIAGEEERLEAALAGHLEREDAESAAEQAFDGSAWGERLRRYEMTNERALLRILETLRQRQPEANAANPPPGPGPAARAVEQALAEATVALAKPASIPAEPSRPEPTVTLAGPDAPSAEPAPPEPTDAPEEPAAVRAEPPPPTTEKDDAPEANGPTEDSDLAWKILSALGVGPSRETAAGNAGSAATTDPGCKSDDPDRRTPDQDPAMAESRPRGDAPGGSADHTEAATVGVEVARSNDRVLRNLTKVTNGPVAPAGMLAGAILALFALIAQARMLAGAILALFALLVFAGFSTASDGVRDVRYPDAAGEIVSVITSSDKTSEREDVATCKDLVQQRNPPARWGKPRRGSPDGAGSYQEADSPVFAGGGGSVRRSPLRASCGRT